MKPTALLVGKFMHYDSQKIIKFQKEIKILLKVSKTRSRRQKKIERRLENDFFVHWKHFDCKLGFSLFDMKMTSA